MNLETECKLELPCVEMRNSNVTFAPLLGFDPQTVTSLFLLQSLIAMDRCAKTVDFMFLLISRSTYYHKE